VLEFSGANSTGDNSAMVLAGGTVRFSGGGTRSSTIAGSGNLEKTGANTLTLSGSNSYTGGTTVSSGTLVVSNAVFTATIQSGSTTVDFPTPPGVGTNNVLPGPLNTASLASINFSGTGGLTATLTNAPNLKVILTSSAPGNQKPVITAGQSFTIAENSAVGTSVGTLLATDADNPSSLGGWAITGGNTSGAFAINASTGVLTVLGNLNYEATPTYALTVTVSDSTDTSDPVNVTVNVSNVAEFSDVFGSADPSADDNGDGVSNLMAYALGATAANSAVARPELSLTSSNLTLTALVRTNDPKVQILGNASTALTNWPTNTFAGTPAADQTGVVSGVTQKQVFSVERGTDSRQFLRLKATLEP